MLFVNKPNCAQNLSALKLEAVKFTNGALRNSEHLSFPEIFSQKMRHSPHSNRISRNFA